MLDQSRFLAMKNLAKDVRKENEKKFKSFENESIDEAIRDKDEFIKKIINDMSTSFSPGGEGKEEKQIFKANLLIPDDVAFFQAYSKDKNVRNLMNKYAVSIEDVMSKITELNLYSKYIDVFNEEVKEQEEDEHVDDVVDLSKNEAEDLLNEIEDLPIDDGDDEGEALTLEQEEPKEEQSEAVEEEPAYEGNIIDEDNIDIENVNIEDLKAEEEPEVAIEEEPEKAEESEEPEVITEEEYEKIEEPKEDKVVDLEIEEDEVPTTSPDIEIGDEIENISSAVSEFVDEYSKVKRELEFTQAKVDKFNNEKEELKKKLNMSKDENEALAKENDGLRNDIERFYQQSRKLNDEKASLQSKLDEAASEIRRAVGEKVQAQEELDKVMYEAEKLASENDVLKAKINSMEATVKQSTNLLKEIYNTIPKKRFNVK